MFKAGRYLTTLEALAAIVAKTGAKLHLRSVWIVAQLDRMEPIIVIWITLFVAAATLRLAGLRTFNGTDDFLQSLWPYALIALSPILAYRLAVAAFPLGKAMARPTLHFSRVGPWRRLDVLAMRQHRMFGPVGILASLILGLLFNVAFRSFEFLLAVPAMNSDAPAWGMAIFRVMALDVIAMNAIYTICFVMALRSIPMFPKMLGLAWMLDITFQLMIANYMSQAPQLPREVTLALSQLLQGNITKVLISAGVWLPYLLLSDRVNVTYRMRAPVQK